MSDNNQKKPNDSKWKKILIAAVPIVLALVLVLTLILIQNSQKNDDLEVAYTQLIQDIDDGKIESIEMTVGSTSVQLKYKDEEEEKHAIVPSTQAFVELIQEKAQDDNEENNVELIQKPRNALLAFSEGFVSILPTLILVILVILIFQMQGLGDKGKVYDPDVSQDKATDRTDARGVHQVHPHEEGSHPAEATQIFRGRSDVHGRLFQPLLLLEMLPKRLRSDS